MDVGRSRFQAGDSAGLGDADVNAEAIEGLFLRPVVAISGLTGKATAPVSTGEAADKDRETVHNGNEWVERDFPQQPAPGSRLTLFRLAA